VLRRDASLADAGFVEDPSLVDAEVLLEHSVVHDRGRDI
jgi:hypothetical protein